MRLFWPRKRTFFLLERPMPKFEKLTRLLLTSLGLPQFLEKKNWIGEGNLKLHSPGYRALEN